MMGACLLNAFCFGVVLSTGCYALLLAYVLFGCKPRTLLPNSPARNPKKDATVVIAARNEEVSLGACLQSLLAQSCLAQTIVVDDHSSDSTATIAKSFATQHNGVICLSAPSLPEGWTGKSHALYFGAQHVKTPYVLFTDADVIFGRGILDEAIYKMDAERLDHLGGHFFVDCWTIAEEICAPVLVLSSALALFGTAGSKGASTGAFNLVRTTFYETCGGHVPIKSEVVDDIALARLLKAAGAKATFVAMGDNLKVRLFVGFKGFVNAVIRSAIPFLRWGSLAVCCATLACMSLALIPVILLLGLPLVFALTEGGLAATVVCCLGPVPYLLGVICLRFSTPFHNGRFLFQLCFPAALLLLGASVFYAALAQILRRPIAWRGRVYTNNQLTCTRWLPKERVLPADLWK